MTTEIDAPAIYRLPQAKRTLGWILKGRAEAEGDRTFLTCNDRKLSFADIYHDARAVARGLAANGLGAGDYLAMMLPNSVEFVQSWFGAALRNVPMVPINPQYRGFILDAPLRETRARGFVIHRDLLPALDTIDAGIAAKIEWVAVVGGMPATPLPHGLKAIPFESLLRHDGPDPEIEATYRDIHSVMYTSGSTGPSKGVLISNSQFFSSACVFLRSVALTRDDILFTPLPLFHGLASRLGVLPSLMVGAQVVVGERFSGSQFFQQATEANATIGQTIFSIPPVLKAQPPGPYDRAHRMRCMYNAHHDAEFEERFNVRLVEAYGMTETGLCVFTDYPERRIGSSGKVHEDFEIRIVDEFDEPVPVGEPGEIVLRPKRPFITMQGYIDKPADTVAAWRNLWFHTGDVARMDEDGYLFFVDRKKERIRRRGENVSSWDVEAFVALHPDIAECVALPYPASGGEDDIRLFAALPPGSTLTPEALVAWLQPRMPRFMLPRYVEFVPELPHNPTGKIEKYKLSSQPLADGVYDREGKAAA